MNNTNTVNNIFLTHTDAMALRNIMEDLFLPFEVKMDFYNQFMDELMEGMHHITMAGHC
jgi:hypothetical protein